MDWNRLTERSLAELETCDPRYRPTSFWGPGLQKLLADVEGIGLERFKAWPSSGFWFYPRYGKGFTNATVEGTLAHARSLLRNVPEAWFHQSLNGSNEARRDFDAVRLAWDQERWPFDLEGLGESRVGDPWQYFRMTGAEHGWTRPYLNYLLCLAGLSRHVDRPPRRFLELGGGFGVLGEILLSRDPEAVYVDVDIPPLLTVASYYLATVFPDKVSLYDDAVPANGTITANGSTVLPSWRLPDLKGSFDVFLNSFSFQEMEPDVVANYAALVAALDPEWVVSLNSRLGKPTVAQGASIGVVDPVTSNTVVDLFVSHGYELVARYGSPLLNSAGELALLRRRRDLTGHESESPR